MTDHVQQVPNPLDALDLDGLTDHIERTIDALPSTMWEGMTRDLDLADALMYAARRDDLDPAEVARRFRSILGADPVDRDATRDDLRAGALALQNGQGVSGALATMAAA